MGETYLFCTSGPLMVREAGYFYLSRGKRPNLPEITDQHIQSGSHFHLLKLNLLPYFFIYYQIPGNKYNFYNLLRLKKGISCRCHGLQLIQSKTVTVRTPTSSCSQRNCMLLSICNSTKHLLI